MRFKKTILKNGIRVVSEMQPESRAVSVGIWVLSGTRDETEVEAGISHFLEHMVFKGTKTRSAFQIAKSLEQLGGELNAYTTKEYTCYHAIVLREHWQIALDVLSDLICDMQIKKQDFEVEKSVILQEIAMSVDQQDEMIYDEYFAKAFGLNTIGTPILGTETSISKMKLHQIRDRYKSKHAGNQLIVSVAGDIEHQDLTQFIDKRLSKIKKTRVESKRIKPRHKAFRDVIEKPGEQLHLLMGLPVTSFKDQFRFEAFIVNALLGGGMTSKLYQSIREKKGLVYSIYSQLSTFTDFGLMHVYAACEPKNMRSVLQSIKTQIRAVQKNGIRQSDLDLFKTQVKGSLLLGSDDIENRMSSIAVNEMVFGEYRSVDKVIEEIDRVSLRSIRQFMQQYFNSEKWGVLLLGAEAEKLRAYVEDYNLK